MTGKAAKGAILDPMTPVVRTPDETTEQAKSMESLMNEQQQPGDRAAILRAQMRANAAELKELNAGKRAAKAERVAMTPLEKVVAKQATTPVWLPGNLAERVRARMAAGQDQGQAFEEMFAFLRAATYAELSKPAVE